MPEATPSDSAQLEYKWQHLPAEIYFDTNAMLRAGFALDVGWMTELRSIATEYSIKLCCPRVVFEEWSAKLAKHVQDTLTTIKSSIGSLRRLGAEMPDDAERQMTSLGTKAISDYVGDLFTKAGFTIAALPALSLEDLVSESIKAIAPFEQKDKGFRDTVIVESIIAHALEHWMPPRIMVITADEAVANSAARFEHRGVRVVFATPEESPKKLRELLDKENSAYTRHESNLLLRAVKARQEDVFAHIRATPINVSRMWLQGWGDKKDVYGDIKAVRKIEPKAIDGVSTVVAPLSEGIGEDRRAFSIFMTAEIELEVEVTTGGYTGFLGGLLSVPVTPGAIDPSSPIQLPQASWEPTKTTRSTKSISRRLVLDASVDESRAKSGVYTDLRFHGVH